MTRGYKGYGTLSQRAGLPRGMRLGSPKGEWDSREGHAISPDPSTIAESADQVRGRGTGQQPVWLGSAATGSGSVGPLGGRTRPVRVAAVPEVRGQA